MNESLQDDIREAAELDFKDIALALAEEEAEQAKERSNARGTTLHAVQFEYNPNDYEYKRDADGNLLDGYPKLIDGAKTLITEERIKAFADKNKKNKEIAWIYHDHDRYTQEEQDYAEENGNFNKKAGEPKPPHWHIVIRSKQTINADGKKRRTPIRVGLIAKGLGIPDNLVDIVHGVSGFAATLAYFLHKTLKARHQQKHEYDPSEVKATFDWQPIADNYIEQKEYQRGTDIQFGDWIKNLDPSDKHFEYRLWKMAVLYDGISLAELSARQPVLYCDHIDVFTKLRANYLAKRAPLPLWRLNFLITGSPGVGKSDAAIGLARTLYHLQVKPNGEPLTREDDDRIFCMAGGPGVRFQRYDGQPVIIWSDVDGAEIAAEYERQHFVDLIDPTPKPIVTHVKYGDTMLVNTINIFCTTQTKEQFFAELNTLRNKKGLLPAVDNLEQIYRRFPIIIPIEENDFSILLNMKFMDMSDDFREYEVHGHIAGSMKKIRQGLKIKSRLIQIAENQLFGRDAAAIIEAIVDKRTGEQPPHFELGTYDVNTEPLTAEEQALLVPYSKFGIATDPVTYEIPEPKKITNKSIPIEDYKAIEGLLRRQGARHDGAAVTSALVKLGFINPNPDPDDEIVITVDPETGISVEPVSDDEPF